MFTYRQLLILTVTILSTNVIFADILIPSDKLQYRDNPSNQQPQSTIAISNYKVPVVQYGKQIMVQPSKQYHVEVQPVHPNYEAHQDKARSNLQLIGYPHHYSKYQYYHPYNHHLFTKPHGNLHYMKLGSREYVRPSIFVGYANPLTVHRQSYYRRKRSTDLTSTSDKSAVADVATKSTLIDAKHPPVIDSLFPENESTNTNDKHVKNRRRDADFATKSFLFGLDPNKMNSELKDKNLDATGDETQHSLSKRHGTINITPVLLTRKFTPESVKTTATEQPAQQIFSTQAEGQNQEASNTNYENSSPTPSVSSTTTNMEQRSNPITISQMQPSEEKSHESNKYFTNTYASQMPLTISQPFIYSILPNSISNAEIHSSDSKNYPYQENPFNYPIMQQTSDQTSFQETTNVGAINTVQPTQDNIHQQKSSKINEPFYLNMDNYQDNEVDTDNDYYSNDIDYDDDYYNHKSIYLTDASYIFTDRNIGYSRNAPSNYYANVQNNVPVTYVVSPYAQPYAYYYPTTKTYAAYKPYDYNNYYYNTIYSYYQKPPNVPRAISSPAFYYYYY